MKDLHDFGHRISPNGVIRLMHQAGPLGKPTVLEDAYGTQLSHAVRDFYSRPGMCVIALAYIDDRS